MQTVIGVFDTVDEAQRARESLVDAGFDESAVQVRSQSALQGRDDDVSTTSRTSNSDEGFMASIGHFFSKLFGGEQEEVGHYSEAVRRGSSVVAVTLPDESRVEQARATLAAAGAVDIDKRIESWREDGYSGFDPAAQPFGTEEIQAERSRFQPQADSAPADNEMVLPVVREEIEVGKKEYDLGTVRVFTRTETQPVSEQVELREEHVDIQRRPVDRPASEADLKAFGGGSIEVLETAERPVVSKTARVVEEVTVGTQATTRTETVSDQVRNTVVDVENAGQGMPDYRRHYQTELAPLGGRYEDYEPAYQYGSALRADPRYVSRSWDDVEADARNDWTGRYPGSSWERAKLAVKHGWESMTGQR
jgi:stress response protein YsnF